MYALHFECHIPLERIQSLLCNDTNLIVLAFPIQVMNKQYDSIRPMFTNIITRKMRLKSCGHPFMTSTRRGQAQMGRMWTGEECQAPCGRPHRKLKLESTDVILSSSHAKKLSSFFP